MSLFPPVVDKCCSTGCQRDFDGRPCWGDVVVVDEEYDESDWWWIHACEGHEHTGRYMLPVLR